MSTTTYSRKTANEKSIVELQDDTVKWDILFRNNTDEMLFLKQLLISDVFENSVPNLFERLQGFYNELTDLKTDKIDLHEELRNHKNDLNGMMECEDISCETFYYTQHQEIADKIDHHLAQFKKLKLEIFRFCTPLFKKQSEEEQNSSSN